VKKLASDTRRATEHAAEILDSTDTDADVPPQSRDDPRG